MYKRILVPIDGSETSNKALVAALQMARETGAYLTGYEQFGGYSGELISAMRETGNKILNDAMEIAKAAGVEADNLLYDNFGSRLAEVVTDSAKDWQADLIVVGTHGRRGVGRVLMGSGAEQILRMAPVPVLVIRGSEA